MILVAVKSALPATVTLDAATLVNAPAEFNISELALPPPSMAVALSSAIETAPAEKNARVLKFMTSPAALPKSMDVPLNCPLDASRSPVSRPTLIPLGCNRSAEF